MYIVILFVLKPRDIFEEARHDVNDDAIAKIVKEDVDFKSFF